MFCVNVLQRSDHVFTDDASAREAVFGLDAYIVMKTLFRTFQSIVVRLRSFDTEFDRRLRDRISTGLIYCCGKNLFDIQAFYLHTYHWLTMLAKMWERNKDGQLTHGSRQALTLVVNLLTNTYLYSYATDWVCERARMLACMFWQTGTLLAINYWQNSNKNLMVLSPNFEI
jgi:hypothetical protein